MNIGSRLKQVLDERNMTVSQLAREAEVSAQTLYAMIKRDSNKADMDIMARILEALDMDLLEFLELPPRKRKAAKKAVAAEAVIEAAETAEPEAEIEAEPHEEEPEQPVRSRRDLEDFLL